MTDAPTTADEKSTYDVVVEDAGPARKKLTITVPAETIDEKLDGAYATLAGQAALPGFRKGRAPRELLERRFGDNVREETRTQLVADAYSTALEEQEIKPVGEPEPDTKIEELTLEPGKPMTFSLFVEIMPDFELPALEELEIRKPTVEITDEHISTELERQCIQYGEPEKVVGTYKKGDRLLGPGTATKDGDDEPFFRHENIDIVFPGDEDGGRGHVLGLIVEGLADMVKDKKPGDSVTIQTVGPDAHEMEHIRGKKITIEMTIREALRVVAADISKVVEAYQMGSEEILREQVRLALEQRRDEEQRMAMRQQVFEHLTNTVDFELPENLSAQQAAHTVERQRMEMLARGMGMEDVEERLAEIRSETEAQSRTRLKLTFMLHALAEKFEVRVTDQEINGRIAMIAAQRNERPEKLRADLQQTGGLGHLASQLREHKAADRVIDQAKVIEVTQEEWDALIKERRGEAGEKTTTKKTTSTKKSTSKKSSSKKSSTKKTTTKKTSKKKA